MSKLGLQSQSGVIQDLLAILERRLRVYKLLGNALNLGIARTIRARSPQTFIVIRTGSNWAVDDDGFIQRYADEASTIGDPFLREGLCDLMEPPNEPVVQNGELAKLLNERQVQYAGIMKARGYRVGAYNFSVGNPDYPLWPFLQDGIRASDYWLLLHEYGAPFMDSDPVNLALRHRKVMTLLAPDVRAKVKIGISECGIDLGTIGSAGGYRKVWPPTDQRESIDPFLPQLAWYDAELQKDANVEWAALFGLGMQEPWVGLGFDLGEVDTERRKFIRALQPGDVNPPPVIQPPTGAKMTDQDRAWSRLKVARNPNAAIYKAALALYPDALPLGNEDYYVNDAGVKMVAQDFNFATGRCKDGDWGNITFHRYLDDSLWQKPAAGGALDMAALLAQLDARYALKGQGGTSGPLPYKFPAALTASGAIGEEGHPIAGQPFYRLSGASVQLGVSAFVIVTVIGKNGVPKIGQKVVRLFPDGNGEVLETDGNGTISFQNAANSAFTNPGDGPFTIFIPDDSAFKDSDSDPKRVVWKLALSDKVKSLGDFRGQHARQVIQYIEQP